MSDALSEIAKRFLRTKRIEGCTQKTLQAYEYEIHRFIDFVRNETQQEPTLKDLDRDQVEEWLASHDHQSATRSRTLAALKSLSRFCTDRGHLEKNPLDLLKTPRVRKKVISFLSPEEFQNLLQLARDNKGPRQIPGRDYAILALFIGSGIRISELAGLRITDVDLKNKEILVLRKGEKQQRVPFGDPVREALMDWFEYRKDLKVPENEKACFVSNRRKAMSRQTIRNVVKKWMKQAGLWGKKMSPHTLRHSYATAQIAAGTPVQVVQELLGHNQLNTTSKYLHLVDQDRKKAAEKIRF